MSILYRKYQLHSQDEALNGKWYARVKVLNTVSTADLSTEIAHSTTVTEADVVATLKEFETVIRKHLLNGDKVQLNGLGSFYISLKTKLADTAKDVNSNKITGFKVAFRPERKFQRTGSTTTGNASGFYYYPLIQGASAQYFGDLNAADKGSSDSGSTTGDDTKSQG